MSGSQTVQVFVQNRGNGLAVTSLVFGVLAILTCCLPILPWILAVLGILFGAAAIVVAMMRGGAGAGVAAGGLALCLVSLLPIFLVGGLLFGGAVQAIREAERQTKEAERQERQVRTPKATPVAGDIEPDVLDAGAAERPPAVPEPEPAEAAEEAVEKPAGTPEAEPAPKAEYRPGGWSAPPGRRTWTDATGQFEVEAEFGGCAFGTVKLKKPDGSIVEVPLEKLSEEDQAWIRRRR